MSPGVWQEAYTLGYGPLCHTQATVSMTKGTGNDGVIGQGGCQPKVLFLFI